jgi:nitrous oxide reductase
MIKSDPTTEARRQFLKTTIVATAAVMAGVTIREAFGAGDMPHLTDADPTAKAMGYVDDATTSKNKLYKPGSVCANCQLYSGAESGYGDCQLFPGKLVSARGWCTSYTRKAS